MNSKKTTNFLVPNQIGGSIIEEGARQQQIVQQQQIQNIKNNFDESLTDFNDKLKRSLEKVENVRDFVKSPEHILGSQSTKHGEIAEYREVEIVNARRIMEGLVEDRTFDGVGRTAPEDYLIDGVPVQSKFVGGTWKSLDHVLKHMHKYPSFTSKGGYYHIPKDQYETLIKIYRGESVGELSVRTINKSKELIAQLEQTTGKQFTDVVRPSISNYKDVQLCYEDGQCKVKRLDGDEEELKNIHAQKVKTARKTYDEQKAEAQQSTNPSWEEAGKYAAIAALITAGTTAGIKIYNKIKEGKKITEFSNDDWKEIGYDFTKGGIKGGVSGLSIYGLTKLSGLSAPFAAAVVTSSLGAVSLAKDYYDGKISKDDFATQMYGISMEATITGIGTVFGQMLIPIPMLGAIIGATVSKSALLVSQYVLDKKESELIKKMQEEYDNVVTLLDAQEKKYIDYMDTYFSKLGGFIEAAMSKDSAARLYGSINLCHFLGVREDIIIHNISELDKFMQ